MSDTYRNLLVGIELESARDGKGLSPTADSSAAWARALDLAKAHQASLCAMHVLDMDPLARTWAERQGEGSGTWIGEAKVALARLVAEAKQRGCEARSLVHFGKPVEKISEVAKDQGHDLVIVGSRRPSSGMTVYALRGVLLGTTASKLLHLCPTPVWIVRPHAPRPYARIVVATDLTPLGERVLAHAARIAKLDGSTLHVLHAIDTWFAGRGWLFGPAQATIQHELERRLTEARSKLAHQVASTLDRMGIATPPVTYLEIMAPEELILRIARVENADLVALGTAARTGVPGFFVGNTCERILPELACALLVVR